MLRTQVSAKEKVKELKPVKPLELLVEDATHGTPSYISSFMITLGLKIWTGVLLGLGPGGLEDMFMLYKHLLLYFYGTENWADSFSSSSIRRFFPLFYPMKKQDAAWYCYPHNTRCTDALLFHFTIWSTNLPCEQKMCLPGNTEALFAYTPI